MLSERLAEKTCSNPSAIVVGNYCHDTLTLEGGRQVQALGGSVAYITPLLEALGLATHVVAKVGCDFKYQEKLKHAPIVEKDAFTTEFFADLRGGGERRLTAGNVCRPILPEDLPEPGEGEGPAFDLGLAVGVAGEVLPETLERLARLSRHTVVDLQALVRVISPKGEITLRRLEESPFVALLPQVSYLKASGCEAAFFDPLAWARRCEAVIVTDGPNGCTVFTRNGVAKVAAFSSTEVDPTGAGDSFLAGCVVGLSRGLDVESAARMGNYFGSLAVGQVGVPVLNSAHIERWTRLHGTASSTRSCNGS